MTLEEQFEQVRQSGERNMLDRHCVGTVADSMELYELGDVASNRKEYGKLLKKIAKGE